MGLSTNGTSTVTLTFSPNISGVGGTVSFDTTQSTDNTSTLASQIKLGMTTVVAATHLTTSTNPLTFTVLSVPESASMSLLGIGMAGLLSFRRLFKRKAVVRSKSRELIDGDRQARVVILREPGVRSEECHDSRP